MSDHLPVPEPPNPDGDDFLADLGAELGAPPRDDSAISSSRSSR
jgi:hypothetical protein